MVSIAVLTGLVLLAGPALASGELETDSVTPAPAPVAAGPLAEPDVMPPEALADSPPEDPVVVEQVPDPLPPGVIARAQFTSEVVQREPTDQLEQLTTDYAEVSFFTEFVGLEGHSLTHRWEYGGRVISEVPFEIGGPRWRVYSTKTLAPEWIGEWTVSVLDSAGRVLERRTLEYLQPVPDAPGVPEVPAAPAGGSSSP